MPYFTIPLPLSPLLLPLLAPAAVVAYKEVHGDLFVPFNFVVPDNDPNYPQEAWGVKLGWGLNTMKYQGNTPSQCTLSMHP